MTLSEPMLTIEQAYRKRDDTVQAARDEYARELARLKMSMQAKIDAAEHQLITDTHRRLDFVLSPDRKEAA